MSLYGKILAFLCVLGAIGLVSLAAADIGKRRAWAYAVYRHDLHIKGLPVDAEEKDPEGRPLQLAMGEQTQRELFPSGNPVRTQQDEVKRVQSQLQQAVQSAGGKQQQIALYSRFLLPLATTSIERERLLDCQTYFGTAKAAKQVQDWFAQSYQQANTTRPKDVQSFELAFMDALYARNGEPNGGPLAEAFLKVYRAAPNKPFQQVYDETLDGQLSQLQARFDQSFQEALKTGPSVDFPAEGDTLDDRRRAIAHLLFSLMDVLPRQEVAGGQLEGKGQALVQDPAFQRVVAVVGLRAAVNELHQQGLKLNQIASELDRDYEREQLAFVTAHQRRISEQLLPAARRVAEENAKLTEQQERNRQHEKELAGRRQDVKKFQAELDDSRQATTKQLQGLRRMSQALLDVRLQVRDALEKNRQREQELRKLEEGR